MKKQQKRYILTIKANNANKLTAALLVTDLLLEDHIVTTLHPNAILTMLEAFAHAYESKVADMGMRIPDALMDNCLAKAAVIFDRLAEATRQTIHDRGIIQRAMIATGQVQPHGGQE